MSKNKVCENCNKYYDLKKENANLKSSIQYIKEAKDEVISELHKELEDLKAKHDELSNDYDLLANIYADDITKIQAEYNNLQKQYNNLQNSYDELYGTYKEQKDIIKELKALTQGLTPEMIRRLKEAIELKTLCPLCNLELAHCNYEDCSNVAYTKDDDDFAFYNESEGMK
jgi:chromosome segregation ATPase